MKLVLFDTWIVENIVYLNFRISALLSLHNLFKFLYQCTVISVIAMAHLVLFCFTLNLTDACPDYLSVRSRAMQKPVNWFVMQIIWIVPLWCRVLPGGVSEQILIVYLFINIFLYHWFSLNVAGLSKSSNGSFLSTHDADVFYGAQE